MKDIKIPFDERGLQSYPQTYWTGFEWRDNYEFTGTLTITGYVRGRSAARMVLEGDGQRYEMFMKDTDDLIHTSVIDHGKVTGRWTFVKRGVDYGIQKVGEE